VNDRDARPEPSRATDRYTDAAGLEVVCAPLWHPETPHLLDDGGLLFVETDSGRACVYYPDGLLATFSVPGGRPYGCVFGSDARLYIAQSGLDDPGDPARIAPRCVPPSLQRASADGTLVEILCTSGDGVEFISPNSLVWGADGTLYLSDSGHWDPENRTDPGRIYAIDADRTARVVLEPGHVFPNGIAYESDGCLVWVESYTRVVGRLHPDGRTEHVTTLPEGHTPEAVKIDADGRLWIANFEAGGLDVIERDGTPVRQVHVGGVPINFLWSDGWMYVVDFGFEENDVDGIRPGRIVRVPSRTRGAPVHHGAIR
jgi:gluconolactonase